ncbi:hypothetical protein [Pyxidicoccus xibeiensis]|uniref:hypothetical protein n=1 Tax=Pyxidicoccus xibeiensis TaxID=2906759 RepID=UPI0020A81285|nr:hypothetical protein [Pyxidicoccus xibeiensis]MCP3141588.1 hypothetical protein [Pyxidicoccus xibeiensis]
MTRLRDLLTPRSRLSCLAVGSEPIDLLECERAVAKVGHEVHPGSGSGEENGLLRARRQEARG